MSLVVQERTVVQERIDSGINEEWKKQHMVARYNCGLYDYQSDIQVNWVVSG